MLLESLFLNINKDEVVCEMTRRISQGAIASIEDLREHFARHITPDATALNIEHLSPNFINEVRTFFSLIPDKVRTLAMSFDNISSISKIILKHPVANDSTFRKIPTLILDFPFVSRYIEHEQIAKLAKGLDLIPNNFSILALTTKNTDCYLSCSCPFTHATTPNIRNILSAVPEHIKILYLHVDAFIGREPDEIIEILSSLHTGLKLQFLIPIKEIEDKSDILNNNWPYDFARILEKIISASPINAGYDADRALQALSWLPLEKFPIEICYSLMKGISTIKYPTPHMVALAEDLTVILKMKSSKKQVHTDTQFFLNLELKKYYAWMKEHGPTADMQLQATGAEELRFNWVKGVPIAKVMLYRFMAKYNPVTVLKQVHKQSTNFIKRLLKPKG